MDQLFPTTDEALAALALENPPDGPWRTGFAFWEALVQGRAPDRWTLRRLVTPESLPAWGNFRAAREFLDGTTLTTRADSPAPGVAYVKFVTTPAQGFIATGPTAIKARAIATLQHRPELGGWRVHAIGDYLRPEELPLLPGRGK